ncbi:hypothetical protein BFC17_00515 [Alteromonas lipolytica]|uniref:DUF3080 domain-containing protein n=2 Tax=Alteromonas lipolytica TaxID=1856405 RepID=A0A1E8FLA4_9ALTE|nr:hypothetical protein BFC17_00515 [Alteromonas lipolytica]
MNLTRFYQLQQCELGNVVAQRNTALGKVQHLSQRLIYEQHLLAALTDCMNFVRSKKDEDHQELLATLNAWHSLKQQAYPLHWANMLLLSDETRAAFNRPRADLLYGEQIDIAGQLALFKQLSDAATPSARIENLEVTLQAIGVTRLPASVWQAQQYLATVLPDLTQQLDPALAAVACPDGSASEQANILRNVFYLFFIERIQPVGGRINDFNYQFEALLSSWQNAASLPQPFRKFMQQQQAYFVSYQQAVQAHVKLWQRFLSRCHLSPTAPRG